MQQMIDDYLKILSTNPHFYASLIQSFLTGYKRPCEIKLIFTVLPIMLYKDSREKLVNANSTSRIDTIFKNSISVGSQNNPKHLSGKVRFSGFYERHKMLQQPCKKALIILTSENKVLFTDKGECLICKKIHYKDFESENRKWLKAAYNLGVIFSKSNKHQISDYLGVELS